jgi:hypothetical protein
MSTKKKPSPDSVVILGDAKHLLEIIASLQKQQRRQQPGRPPIPILERVDPHQLKMSQSRCTGNKMRVSNVETRPP